MGFEVPPGENGPERGPRDVDKDPSQWEQEKLEVQEALDSARAEKAHLESLLENEEGEEKAKTEALIAEVEELIEGFESYLS